MVGPPSAGDVVERGAEQARLRRGSRAVAVTAVIVIALLAGWYAHYRVTVDRAAKDAAVTTAARALRAAPAGYDRAHLDIRLRNARATGVHVRSVGLVYGVRAVLPGRPAAGRVGAGAFSIRPGGSRIVRFPAAGATLCRALTSRSRVVRLAVVLPSGSVRPTTLRVRAPEVTAADTAWRTALGTFHCE